MFAFAITCFEIISRALPFFGLSQPEIMRKVSAVFEFSQRALDRRGIAEAEQHEDWIEVQ